MRSATPVQGTLDELGTPLREVTFVVVDLETTGGRAGGDDITEIGAVKVRGGVVLGELQTLVRPRTSIPAFIQVLTGITDAMVQGAPPIQVALPSFLEFAAGTVLVAHNAGFDISFLKAATRELGLTWPGHRVLDTVHLARQVMPRGEVANHKLSTLAAHVGATTSPDHRALHDARATVDVLHACLERVGNLGVHTLEELSSYTSRVTPAQRRKRYLADQLPDAPGVYVFKDDRGRPLYVGTSRSIRTRVRSYFTASEQRTRMSEMVGLAASVTPVVCQSTLEAQIREVRLIAEHAPRYNRRSRRPDKVSWVKLTDEPFPRLSVVREVRDDEGTYAGPFGTRSMADAAIAGLHESLPLRQCTTRISLRGKGSACALAEMGRCGAPCEGRTSRAEYAGIADQARAALAGDAREVSATLRERLAQLAVAQRYEDAGIVRDRFRALVTGAARVQRIGALSAVPELVAARRRELGGWELVLVRHGSFAGTAISPRGADPMPYVDTLTSTGEVHPAPVGPRPVGLLEETELVLRWLEQPGVRLVRLEGTWAMPVHGAGSLRADLGGVLHLDPTQDAEMARPDASDGVDPRDETAASDRADGLTRSSVERALSRQPWAFDREAQLLALAPETRAQLPRADGRTARTGEATGADSAADPAAGLPRGRARAPGRDRSRALG